jgi:hypothetical protein
MTDDASALRSGWTRHARLEPRQVVISADFVASNQCFDRRQKLPIANVFGVDLIGISVQHTLAGIMHLLLEQLDLGRIHTRARRSRFSQSVCQTGQPVAPMGGAAEFPTQFLDLRRMPRAWRRGHRLICFRHVAVRRMSDRHLDFAEKGFEVATPTSRL